MYTLMNEEHEQFFVKFHWIGELGGVHSFVWDEALEICGQGFGKLSYTHGYI